MPYQLDFANTLLMAAQFRQLFLAKDVQKDMGGQTLETELFYR
ncbi:hypothetical protein [Calothrix sp. NIES-3974]|nr:hypothetical protein [Calothrix sp. NIES-3974]BAZ05781.1 hypothetical protein NIES3974_24360 [Calothrix sp. NIES-3974]